MHCTHRFPTHCALSRHCPSEEDERRPSHCRVFHLDAANSTRLSPDSIGENGAAVARSTTKKLFNSYFLHRPFYLIFPLNFYGCGKEKKQRRWRCPRKLAPLSVPRDALSPFLMDDVREAFVLSSAVVLASEEEECNQRREMLFLPLPARDFFLLACFALCLSRLKRAQSFYPRLVHRHFRSRDGNRDDGKWD